jgi:hypothetical protein
MLLLSASVCNRQRVDDSNMSLLLSASVCNRQRFDDSNMSLGFSGSKPGSHACRPRST